MDWKRTWAVMVALSVALVGCRAATDNNRPCTLKKKGPDGTAVAITEGELRAKTGFSKDFISFGVVECEDLICVRDSTFAGNADSTAPAMGYCSVGCDPKNPCVSFDDAMDRDPNTKLGCRALMLDAVTLETVCPSNLQPGQVNWCKEVNNVKSPYFCARTPKTSAADGGI